ncbi:MAG: hypothetical protein D3906_12295, partial [Candidatus Electrothrix sp. AUS1_2]|nr:hypothetical protein [Candidatus Electrothrix sp. AUS1_2]
MILKITIRPDRFQRVLSGEMKEHRIPFQHIDLGSEKYDLVEFRSAFGVRLLVVLLGIERDCTSSEYVLKLGGLKSSGFSSGSGIPKS